MDLVIVKTKRDDYVFSADKVSFFVKDDGTLVVDVIIAREAKNAAVFASGDWLRCYLQYGIGAKH